MIASWGEREGPLRICHVQVLPLLSGVQRSMLEIFKHLDRSRYQPYVVCQCQGPLTDELRRLGVPFFTVPSLVRPIRLVSDFRAYRALRRIFRQQAFHAVHTHSSKPGVLARLAARHAGVPRIIHHVRGYAFHEFSPSYQRLALSRVEKWAAGYCDRVIFVNHEERTLSVQHGWLPEHKCLTVYNGVDLAAFSPVERLAARHRFRQQHRLAERDVAILVIGRLDKQKQPLILPQIAARLEAQRLPAPWRMLVVGSGSLESDLRQSVTRQQLGRRIHLMGWSRTPLDAYHGADIVLQPSLWEGLPRTLIEAQAAGQPVVASNVKGNREIVSQETGLLCPPKDPAAYAQALATLIGSSELREHFGLAARRRAEQLFDSTVNNRKIIALYDELLGEAPTIGPLRQAA